MAGFHNRNAFAASVKRGYELKGCSTKRSKSFRKALGGGLPESVYVNKDDPNYRYNYGKKYTERQLKILNGIIPYQTVRSTDLYALMKKAEQMKDYLFLSVFSYCSYLLPLQKRINGAVLNSPEVSVCFICFLSRLYGPASRHSRRYTWRELFLLQWS